MLAGNPGMTEAEGVCRTCARNAIHRLREKLRVCTTRSSTHRNSMLQNSARLFSERRGSLEGGDHTVGQADREMPARGGEGNRIKARMPKVEFDVASVRARRRLPEANGAVPGPGQDPVPGRMEGKPQHVVRVAGEGSWFLGRDVPETKGRVGGVADGGQRLGIRAERQARQESPAAEQRQAPIASQLAELHRLVDAAAGRQPATVGAKGDGAN